MITDKAQLNEIAQELAEVDLQIKDLEQQKKSLRDDLFQYSTLENSQGILGRRTITMPKGLLGKIGISEIDFISTRYPGWKVIDKKIELEECIVEYLLEEDPDFKSFSVEVPRLGKRVVVGKTIQRNSPTLDQRSIQRVLPDLFDRIYVPTISYQLDPVALEKAIEADKSLVADLEFHLIHPTPIKKLAPIREVKDAD